MSIFEPEYSRIRREAHALGKRDMLEQVEHLFAQWASTHPNEVVRDELWGFVMKIREEASA